MTTALERKQKRAAGGGEKKKQVANEIKVKCFPLVTYAEELQQLVAEKSMLADLKRRLPRGEAPPTPAADKHMLHEEFFDQGLGFPLHNFVCGLLFFFGCQLHHQRPNGVLHSANFITFCECFL